MPRTHPPFAATVDAVHPLRRTMPRSSPLASAATAVLSVLIVLVAVGCGGGTPGARPTPIDAPVTEDPPGTNPLNPSDLPNDPITPNRPINPSNPIDPSDPITPINPNVPTGAGGSQGTIPAISFSPLTVFDPMLSGKAAFSVLVPQGWRASGEVQWLPFLSRQAFLQTRVQDPVTGVTIDWLPVQNFMYFTPPAGFDVPIGGNYQGKEYRPPIVDPLQFVREYWMPTTLAHLQAANVVFVEDQPIIANEFIRLFAGPADAGAWRIRYEYVAGDGNVWEQDVWFALLWSGSDPVSWFVEFASTAGAPKGELDRQAGLVSAVIASRATTIEWEADLRIVQQLFYDSIRQQMADTQRLVAMLGQMRAESQALQQQVFDERMASLDRRNEIFRETLGGVQGYVDPVNQAIVQLPLGWNTYWVNEAGEYLAVGDPNFDPNTMNDGTWIILQPRG